MESTTPYPLIRCLCGFTIGLLAYRLSQWASAMRILTFKFLPEAIGASILVLLFGRTTDIYIVILCGLFIAALSQRNSISDKILSMKIPYYLGIYSFSLYLMHVPFAAIVDYVVPELSLYISVPIKTIGALGLSVLTYHFIENPSRAYLQKIGKDRAEIYSLDVK